MLFLVVLNSRPKMQIHKQLAALVAKKWLIRGEANHPDRDARQRSYALTKSGLKQTSIHRAHLIDADRMFTRLLTTKEVEALDRLNTRLVGAINTGALNGKADLATACAKGTLSLPRRWHQ